MAVLGVLHESRDASKSADYKFTFKISYLVQVSYETGKRGARAAMQEVETLFPLGTSFTTAATTTVGKSIGRTEEVENGILIKSYSAKEWQNHPGLFVVDVEFGSDAPDPDFQAKDPTQRLARFRFQNERYKAALESDVNGLVLQNSAKTPYDPVESDSTQLVMEIQKNLAWFDPSFFQDYIDFVNTTPFLWCLPYQCKVHDISSEGSQFENGVRFFPAKLVLHIRKSERVRLVSGVIDSKPWRLYLLDIGDEYWDAGDDVFRRFTDGNGRPLGKPQLLDGGGSPLAHGSPAVFNEFQKFQEGSYTALAFLFLPGL